MKELIRKILNDKYAKIAFWLLVLLYFVILFADFISPYSNYYSNRELSYVPPSVVYTINEHGKLSRPYTYNYTRQYDEDLMQTVYKQDRSKKYYIKLFPKAEGYRFLGIIPTHRHLFGVDKGGEIHILGTDINLVITDLKLLPKTCI